MLSLGVYFQLIYLFHRYLDMMIRYLYVNYVLIKKCKIEKLLYMY